MKYDHKTIEEKWQAIWKETNLYRTADDNKKEKYYVLDMFPYPSGEGLHVGHPKGYIATDIIARQKMMEGKNVLHPMGWDAFGLPAENYALKNKVHPSVAVAKNIKRFKEQLDKIGFSYDWEREINTTDPNFYKWTQWIFLKLFEKGLAYEAFAPINWCPSCKTGLANEDVENGRCERCGTPVEQRPMRQWLLKITDYAEKMLDGLKDLKWPESIKDSQRHWIGRSEGAELDFQLVDSSEKITVFTTRPDTLFGVTYLVLAPEHPLVTVLADKIKNLKQVKKYIEAAAKKTEIDRTSEGRERTGVELEGVQVINPVNNEVVPVWIADYVLGDYGTGAVMAVPAHDKDYNFAQENNLPIRHVVIPTVTDHNNPPRSDKKTVERRTIHALVKNLKTGKFLAMKWKEQPWTGFIVGGVDEGEDIVEAARREVREETGYIHLEFKKVLGGPVQAHYFAAHKDENRLAYTTAIYFELQNEEKVEISKEEEAKHEAVWLDIKDITPEKMTCAELSIWFSRLEHDKPYTESGVLYNSGKFSGRHSDEVKKEITKEAGGRWVIRYRLRDWVFSRQRYWGEPIPIIHCEKCGAVPVPEKDLPVVLPEVEFYEPTGTGESPLAGISDWVNVDCPKCGGKGKRETNTMPQWAGSSWYYLRYIDPQNNEVLVDKKKEKHWSPVDIYVGGAEHATRHLIYARFWHKFLYDIGVVSYPEPFVRYTNQGLIMGADGRKMGKRYGNVVNPDDMVEMYGADAFRVYEMFLSPFTQAANFIEAGVGGAESFLGRILSLSEQLTDKVSEDKKLTALVHQTIKKVTEDIENFKFNTAVSSLMILTNALGSRETMSQEYFSILVQLLAPFAPHLAEELWQNLGNKDSIFKSVWPKYDESLLINETLTIAVQVNGKLRATFEVFSSASEQEIKERALSQTSLKKWIEGKEIKKVIVVKGKLVSIVV